jgi:hypothetical protein
MIHWNGGEYASNDAFLIRILAIDTITARLTVDTVYAIATVQPLLTLCTWCTVLAIHSVATVQTLLALGTGRTILAVDTVAPWRTVFAVDSIASWSAILAVDAIASILNIGPNLAHKLNLRLHRSPKIDAQHLIGCLEVSYFCAKFGNRGPCISLNSLALSSPLLPLCRNNTAYDIDNNVSQFVHELRLI